jgi:hypothetical protein
VSGSIYNNGSAWGQWSGTTTLLTWSIGAHGLILASQYGSGTQYEYIFEVGDTAFNYRWQIYTDNNANTLAFYSPETNEVIIATGSPTTWGYFRLVKATATTFALEYVAQGGTSFTTIASTTVSSSNLANWNIFRAIVDAGTCTNAAARSWRLHSPPLSQADQLLERASNVPVNTTDLKDAYCDGSTPVAATWGQSTGSAARHLTVTGTAVYNIDDPISSGTAIASHTAFLYEFYAGSTADLGATSATQLQDFAGASSPGLGGAFNPTTPSEFGFDALTLGGSFSAAPAGEPGEGSTQALASTQQGAQTQEGSTFASTLGGAFNPAQSDEQASDALTLGNASNAPLEVSSSSYTSAGAFSSPTGVSEEYSTGSVLATTVFSSSHTAFEEWAAGNFAGQLGVSVPSGVFPELAGIASSALGSAQPTGVAEDFPGWSTLAFSSNFITSDTGYEEWFGGGSSSSVGTVSSAQSFAYESYVSVSAVASSLASGFSEESSEGSTAGAVNLSFSHTAFEEWVAAGSGVSFSIGSASAVEAVFGAGSAVAQAFNSYTGASAEASEGSTIGSVNLSFSYTAFEEWGSAGSLQDLANAQTAATLEFVAQAHQSAITTATMTAFAPEYPHPYTYVQDLPMFHPGWLEYSGAGSTTSLGSPQYPFFEEWLGWVLPPNFAGVAGPAQKVRIFSYSSTVETRSYYAVTTAKAYFLQVVKMSDCETIQLQRVAGDTYPTTLAFTDGCRPVNLTGYTQFVLKLVSANYPPVSLAGSLVDARLGKVAFGPTVQQAAELSAGVYAFEVTALSPEGLQRTLLMGDLEILSRPR